MDRSTFWRLLGSCSFVRKFWREIDPNLCPELNSATNIVAETPVAVQATKQQSMDRTMIRAMAWTGAGRWTTQLLTWASTIVVARILAPSDYGLFGMATLYLGLVALISEFGLGQAVITLREMSSEHIAQFNSLSIASGTLLFGVSCVAANPLAKFFHSPKLAPVIIVMSISFLISGAQVVPDALLQRDLRFKLLASFDTLRALTQALTTITLAWLGLSYWSLVIGNLAGVIACVVLCVGARHHSFAWPRIAEIKQALRFSTDVLGSRIAWYTYSNSDFLVAGRMLGQAPLGAYTIAWTIASTPVEKITNMITRVTPAFFSAVREDKVELQRYLLKITQGLSLLTFPASLGMALVADQFVLFVLGPKWLAASTPLRLLAIYAALRSITTLLPSILIATRHSRFVMWNGVVAALLFPPAFYFSSHWGTTGIAATWIVLYPLSTAPFMWRMLVEIELPFQTYLYSLLPAIRACLVMVMMVVAVRLVTPSTWPIGVRFAISVLTGALGYLAILVLAERQRLFGFYALLRGEKS